MTMKGRKQCEAPSTGSHWKPLTTDESGFSESTVNVPPCGWRMAIGNEDPVDWSIGPMMPANECY